MRAHVIQNGAVVNTIEVASLSFMPGLIDASLGGSIGDLWNGVAFSKPVVTPVVPDSISPRQFRQSLTHSGFRSTVENAIAASDADTKDWYEFATEFQRNHPKVLSMAQQLGYTPAQIDAVWTYGAGI